MKIKCSKFFKKLISSVTIATILFSNISFTSFAFGKFNQPFFSASPFESRKEGCFGYAETYKVCNLNAGMKEYFHDLCCVGTEGTEWGKDGFSPLGRAVCKNGSISRDLLYEYFDYRKIKSIFKDAFTRTNFFHKKIEEKWEHVESMGNVKLVPLNDFVEGCNQIGEDLFNEIFNDGDSICCIYSKGTKGSRMRKNFMKTCLESSPCLVLEFWAKTENGDYPWLCPDGYGLSFSIDSQRAYFNGALLSDFDRRNNNTVVSTCDLLSSKKVRRSNFSCFLDEVSQDSVKETCIHQFSFKWHIDEPLFAKLVSENVVPYVCADDKMRSIYKYAFKKSNGKLKCIINQPGKYDQPDEKLSQVSKSDRLELAEKLGERFQNIKVISEEWVLEIEEQVRQAENDFRHIREHRREFEIKATEPQTNDDRPETLRLATEWQAREAQSRLDVKMLEIKKIKAEIDKNQISQGLIKSLIEKEQELLHRSQSSTELSDDTLHKQVSIEKQIKQLQEDFKRLETIIIEEKYQLMEAQKYVDELDRDCMFALVTFLVAFNVARMDQDPSQPHRQ